MILWSRTYPDNPERPHDFVAKDGDASVGRIYRVEMAEGRAWLWAANGITASSGTVGCALSGHEPTKQGAADRVRAAWGMWLGMGKGISP